MKGTECKYVIKTCPTCKKEKLIHSFAKQCKECRRVELTSRGKDVTNPIYREPVVAVKPTGEIFMESVNIRTLKKELLNLGVDVKEQSLRGHTAKTITYLGKDVKYWNYKSLYILYRKDFSQPLVNKIFLSLLTKTTKPYKIRDSSISEEMKKVISDVLFMRRNRKLKIKTISEKLGLNRSTVTQILTGRRYGGITGIVYKRAYNKYGADGDVLEPKLS